MWLSFDTQVYPTEISYTKFLKHPQNLAEALYMIRNSDLTAIKTKLFLMSIYELVFYSSLLRNR